MSNRERAAAAAIIQDTINNPPTHTIGKPTVYDVAKPVYPPTHPTFIQLTGGVNRVGIRFDTGNTSIGTKPQEITFYWRKLTLATSGNITVCIRKASDDTIAATLAQWPVEGDTQQPGGELRTAVVGGSNDYAVVANDLLLIEFPSGIEIAMNPTVANPVGTFTSRSFNGSVWSNTANAIAGRIRTRVETGP